MGNLIKASSALGLLSIGILGLAGCAAGTFLSSGNPVSASAAITKMHGAVHGGQQPVSGAVIQLYAAGTTGYGSAATALIPISAQVPFTGTGTGAMTDANGGFNIGGDFTCPSANSQMYLTATGGNPGLVGAGVNNGNSSMMAALGACSSLSLATYVNLNEATTVAAVWALQQFVGVTPGATLASQPGINSAGTISMPAFTIGASASNSQGLANAFAMANILAPFSTGISPTSVLSATSTTKYTVENWQVNGLANILAYCINSDPSKTSNCSTLFGGTATLSGSAPADTLQAAYAIATNPNFNVTAIFNLAGGTPPFVPFSTSVNDFTIALNAQPSTLTGKYLDTAVDIQFDSLGNLWAANTCHSNHGSCTAPLQETSEFLFEFDGLGNPIGSKVTGYNLGSVSTGTPTTMAVSYGFNNALYLAIDLQNNVWVADNTDGVIFQVPGSSAYGAAPGNVGSNFNLGLTTTNSGPSPIAVDSTNNVWFADRGSPAGGAVNWVTGNTLATNNVKAVGYITPGTSISTGGPLTGGALSPVSAGGAVFSIAVDLTPAATYSGAPFVFANDGANFTYGQIVQAFSTAGSTAGTTSATNVTLGSITPVSPFGDVELAASSRKTTLADVIGVNYNGTSYTTFATKNGIGNAIDGNNNLWIVNGTTLLATPGTFPTNSLSKIVSTYGTNAATGALTASAVANVYTSLAIGLNYPFGSGLPAILRIDGGNNLWLTGTNATYGAWFQFKNDGTELSGSLGYIGSTGSGQTAVRGTNTFGHRTNAIDASGNLWTTGTASNANQFFILVGQAVPTVNPLSQALYVTRTNASATFGRVGTRP